MERSLKRVCEDVLWVSPHAVGCRARQASIPCGPPTPVSIPPRFFLGMMPDIFCAAAALYGQWPSIAGVQSIGKVHLKGLTHRRQNSLPARNTKFRCFATRVIAANNVCTRDPGGAVHSSLDVLSTN